MACNAKKLKRNDVIDGESIINFNDVDINEDILSTAGNENPLFTKGTIYKDQIYVENQFFFQTQGIIADL